ncbi:MAG: hypothetical protein ACYC7D_03465 [Nitrososphaerales archaeon]
MTETVVWYLLKKEEKASEENIFTLQVEPPLSESQAPFSSFFLGRILPSIQAKHPDFSYELRKKDTLVTDIVFKGASPEQRKERLNQRLHGRSTRLWSGAKNKIRKRRKIRVILA